MEVPIVISVEKLKSIGVTLSQAKTESEQFLALLKGIRRVVRPGVAVLGVILVISTIVGINYGVFSDNVESDFKDNFIVGLLLTMAFVIVSIAWDWHLSIKIIFASAKLESLECSKDWLNYISPEEYPEACVNFCKACDEHESLGAAAKGFVEQGRMPTVYEYDSFKKASNALNTAKDEADKAEEEAGEALKDSALKAEKIELARKACSSFMQAS